MGIRTRPLLVFDGDCGFCRSWVARWQRSLDGYVDVAPAQQVALHHREIPPEVFARSVVLIEPTGAVITGAEAVFRALARPPGGGAALWAYRHVPGFASLSELAYRTIAGHRDRAARVTRALWGAHVVPPGDRLTMWIFVRLIGVVYTVAFASMAVQVIGLVGRDGILPAHTYLERVAASYGFERFFLVPTLAWFHSSNAFLVGSCIAGLAVSLLVTVGVAPGPLLLAAWALYLSTASVGGDFLLFQWDALLLETGIVATLVARWTPRSRAHDPRQPSRAGVLLVRWLLFRLMFSSAIVKLASGDPTWRHLTALEYHYETQPLPPWTAWYAFQLPAWFQQSSTFVMFVIEGLMPFLAFAPRRPRFVAAGALLFLQTLILITGNYGFFNWLALVLCVVLFDDAVWPAWLRRRARIHWAPALEASPSGFRDAVVHGEAAAMEDAPPERTARPPARHPVRIVAAGLFVLSLCPLLLAMRVPPRRLGLLLPAYQLLAPLRSINAYGLFQVMTTERPEILVEGSVDGLTWRPYAFRWKPGDPQRKPPFVIGHMPRLDWQMWFAALSAGNPPPWFLAFSQRLLEGSKPVLALLASDPFPGDPPRFIRATLYRYRFTDPATRRATGAWWRREKLGLYVPVVTLEGGRLVPAAPKVQSSSRSSSWSPPRGSPPKRSLPVSDPNPFHTTMLFRTAA